MVTEAKQNRDHHHAYRKTERSPHHWTPSAHLVQEESGNQRADEEHALHSAADEETKVASKADILLKRGWNEVAASISEDQRDNDARLTRQG